MKPIKVSLVLRYFTVGGLERVVSALANSYVARGIDTQVVVLSSGKRNALITEIDHRVDLALFSGPPSETLRALRKVTRGRLVHLHFGDGIIHPLARLALEQRKVIVTYHNVYRHKRTWLTNRIDQLCARRAAGVIAVSEAVKEFCVRDVRILGDKVRVIPNGIAITPAPPRDRDVNGALNVICVASLYPHKNQQALLEGVALARREGLDVRLRVIGDGPSMGELFRRSVELELRSAVEWYGATWRRDFVQPLLASSHVFASASRFEGLPLSVLEGMAHSLAMILSDIPPHHEAAGDDGALYFHPDQPGQFAERLRQVAADRALLARLQDGSKARAARFDLVPCVDAHVALYEEVVAA